MLIPVISLSFLAWVPAAQAFWRARTAGWFITTALLAVASVTIVTGMAMDADGAVFGLLLIGAGVGGVAAAGAGRKVVFSRPQPTVGPVQTSEGGLPVSGAADPAVTRVLENRERRRRAKEIVSSDPAMALELGIGRPDVPGGFVDGGLVDLNNVTPAGMVEALGWDPAVAEAFVAGRDARRGYTSLTEIGALSGLDPAALEMDAERIIVLPYRGGRRPTQAS